MGQINLVFWGKGTTISDAQVVSFWAFVWLTLGILIVLLNCSCGWLILVFVAPVLSGGGFLFDG